MSLYYEDFPADDGAEPQLPPLLTAVKVPSGQNVMAKALASGATAEVGTVFYGEDTDVTDIALVLGPEVPLRKAGQMLYAMMIGVGDAIGGDEATFDVVSAACAFSATIARARARNDALFFMLPLDVLFD